MQKTRQNILEYLKEHGEATVDELSYALGNLTPVTVRHHLDVLRSEGLIAVPIVRHRSTPGRPKYAYCLTERALELFPKNYRNLTDYMLTELKETFDQAQVGTILDGVAGRIAAQAPSPREGETIRECLQRIAAYLTEQGYTARWEEHAEGITLHVTNCPYHRVAEQHGEICLMDHKLISRLLGLPAQRIATLTKGDPSCVYLIPTETL